MPIKKQEPIITPDYRILNPEKKSLTIEKFRELSGLHELPDEQAEEMVNSIHLLAKILYGFVQENPTFCIDSQYVVNLEDNSTQNLKEAA